MRISQKRTFDYLKYAIGEIILVTIGILFAVTINNWNTENQSNKLERELLLEIADEMQYNIDRLNFLDTVGAGSSIKEVDSLYQMRFDFIQDGLNRKEITQLCQGVAIRGNKFSLNSFAFEQMKETGILYKLEKELTDSIERYYKYIEAQEQYNEGNLQRMDRAFDDCNYGFRALRRDYYIDTLTYLANHQWIFDESSKNYIDMINFIYSAAVNIHNSRRRMMNTIAESEKLKLLITTYLKQ